MVELELFWGRELNLFVKKNKNKTLGNWNRVKKVMGVLPGVKMPAGSLVCVYIWGKGSSHTPEKTAERLGSW